MTVPGLKTRKPTGRVPWPCILLEGEEKAGKSYALAQLSASPRVGTLYWIDLNEGAGDEYGAIPGTRYEIVEHDGSYAQLLAAVQAIKAEARRAADAGEPPVVLGIDTGSAIWDGLKDWASDRAGKASRNRELLKRDPNAEVVISQNLWNDAGARWRKLQTQLLTFPGIVVVTARGKEVTAVDSNGRPIEGQKTWSVQTHREFPYAASVWVRLRRGQRPTVIGARSVHMGIKPNEDAAREIKVPEAKDRLLEWLVFDALRCDPGTAHVRDLQPFHGGQLSEDEKVAEAEEAGEVRRLPAAGQQRDGKWWLTEIGDADEERLRELWKLANADGVLDTDVEDGTGTSLTVGERIKARVELVRAAAKARTTQPQPEPEPESPPEPEPESAGEVLEGEVLDAPTTPQEDPADMCRNTPRRRGVLDALSTLYGGSEVVAAAAADEFGVPLEKVSTARLQDWMTREQRAS